MRKSNITIKSNVYLVTSDNPWRDPAFVSKVSDIRALTILYNLPAYREKLAAWQQALCRIGHYCSGDDEEKHMPFGRILGDNSARIVCRCEIIKTCEDAERGKCK